MFGIYLYQKKKVFVFVTFEFYSASCNFYLLNLANPLRKSSLHLAPCSNCYFVSLCLLSMVALHRLLRTLDKTQSEQTGLLEGRGMGDDVTGCWC